MAYEGPEALQRFLFSRQVFITNPSFEDVGFGPFLVERRELLDEILRTAGPKRSVHISGCKGAGKTIVLVRLGQILTANRKLVYYFDNAALFLESETRWGIRALVGSNQEAYILVDETQNNPGADVWTPLLKNTAGHKITTIGAGVPKFSSMSGSFKTKITADRLFLSSGMLVSENVVQYFSSDATTQGQKDQIKLLLEHIRSYVGGHIYPMMFLAEQLVPAILAGDTAENQVHYLHSSDFRHQQEFIEMVERIVPEINLQVFRALLTTNPDPSSLTELQQHGLIDQDNAVISQLLFDEYVKSRTGNAVLHDHLAHGIPGVQQLLKFALPNIQWQQYQLHGGPIEDALSFELLLALSHVSALDTRLFNPKLVNYNAGRKPDLYVNTTVGSYVECALTTANTATERKKLDEHISRFYWEDYHDSSKHMAPPYYRIGNAEFAVLNFQNYGDEPMEPFDDFFRGDIYNERVFTFVMTTKCLYRGNQLLT